MSNEFVPRKAEKKRVKLKMAVQGPSGSGKTWGALALAKNLWPDGKVCVVDTENESASLYADSFQFDTIPLAPPFTTARYVQCIDAVAKAGYDVVILDSITPQWDGEGGILRRKEEMDRRPGSNGYTNWATFTPEHEAFKQAILQTPTHVIATMRSRQEYILVANDKGKQVPKKVGMAPVQRDQMDYEFTLVFELGMDHRGEVSKDRTGLFNEKIVDLASPEIAFAIRGWLERGTEAPQAGPVTPASVTGAQPSIRQPANAPAVSQANAVQIVKRIPPANLVFTVAAIKVWPADGDSNASMNVAFTGKLVAPDGKWTADHVTCWHESLFELLQGSLGKVIEVFVTERDKNGRHFIDINDVVSISDPATGEYVEYMDGKPVQIGAQQ
jgi:hypothetical protein